MLCARLATNFLFLLCLPGRPHEVGPCLRSSLQRPDWHRSIWRHWCLKSTETDSLRSSHNRAETGGPALRCSPGRKVFLLEEFPHVFGLFCLWTLVYVSFLLILLMNYFFLDNTNTHTHTICTNAASLRCKGLQQKNITTL